MKQVTEGNEQTKRQLAWKNLFSSLPSVHDRTRRTRKVGSLIKAATLWSVTA